MGFKKVKKEVKYNFLRIIYISNCNFINRWLVGGGIDRYFFKTDVGSAGVDAVLVEFMNTSI